MSFLSKKMILVIAASLSLLLAVGYFYYARQNIVQAHIKQYQVESDLRHQSLLNKLKEQKALLSLLVKQVEFDQQFDPVAFSTYLSSINDASQDNELCLFIPAEHFTFSTKQHATSGCDAFNELSLNQVIHVDESPSMMLSQYVTKQGEAIYISIISALDKIVEDPHSMNFDEYLLIFNPSKMVSQDYMIKDGKLTLNKEISTENAYHHQVYTIDQYDDIQLLYLSAFSDEHMPDQYQLLPLLVALSLFFIPTLITWYITQLRHGKQAIESVLEQKDIEIAYSRKFLSLILENQPEYVFVKDSNFKITYANQHFIQMYPEEQRDKVIGYTTLEQYSPDEMATFLENDKKALQYGYSEVMETITFPDQSRRTLLTKKIRFTGMDGESLILGTASDVTEREQLLKKLESSNDELRQFAYRTSHDLKSPLIGIQHLAKFIKEDIDENNLDEAKLNLDKIFKRSTKLYNLVTDMLTLTKVDYSEGSNDQINFNHLIQMVLAQLDELVVNSKANVVTHIDENIHFTSSSVRLTQVMENLISNACKYHNPDQEKRQIWINVEALERVIQITVKDNGIGLPEGKMDEVFHLFTRYHVNMAEGSGLGLAIVKKHIDKLNGTITAETQNDHTVFIIRLPKNG